ncbi:MAG: sporulation protein YqfD [Firmicutes bacterium]|nr:sporulation protein YqfD [Bacillota bacterium]
MIDFLYRLLWGWVEVTISGRHPERVISQLALSGQRLWAVKKKGDRYHFIAPLTSVAVLRVTLRHQHCHIHFGRRGGIPFMWREFISRPFLGVGALSAVLLIFFTTSRIWIIDVPGTTISPQAKTQLIQAAVAAGIRPGTPHWVMRLRQSRLLMERALPQYAFIGLSVQGVLVRIHVVPLVAKPPNAVPHKIVAAHSGTVTNMLIYMGDPEVGAGDFVRKGQTLISGAVQAPLLARPDRIETAAKGEVFADVRYHVVVTQPYRVMKSRITGVQFIQRLIQVAGNAPVLIQGYGQVPFHFYHTQKIVHPLVWQGVNLPVETTKIVYNKIERRCVTLTKEQALMQARALAARRLQHMVRQGIKLKRQEHVHWSKNGVSVQLIWVVNQNIAVPVTK